MLERAKQKNLSAKELMKMPSEATTVQPLKLSFGIVENAARR